MNKGHKIQLAITAGALIAQVMNPHRIYGLASTLLVLTFAWLGGKWYTEKEYYKGCCSVLNPDKVKE